MKYKISFIIILSIFQINKALSSQNSYQRPDQVIQEVFELFPQDMSIQNSLRESLLNYSFISLIETLMNKSTPIEFRPYIREYEALKGMPIRESVRIFYGSYLRRVSSCRHPFIFVDMTIWQILSEDEKKIVLFHELGHCDLMRKHEPPGTFSIMSERQDFFMNTERVHPETGQLEERVTFNSRTQENLRFLYSELFSKEGNFSDDIQLWIQKNKEEGVDISDMLRSHFQSYFYLSLRVRY